MEQKTPLTLAAQSPPPLYLFEIKGWNRANTETRYIYIIPNPWFFYGVGGAVQRVDVNFPFILSEFVGQSGYWVTNSKSDLG